MSISSIDAKRDGIRVTIEGNEFSRKYTAYHIICESCGAEYLRRRYSSDDEHLCDKCRYLKNKKIKAKANAAVLNVNTRNEIKFQKAIAEMKSQVKWDLKYDRCTKIAEKRVEQYGSIPEMMVAIELLYLGYSITPQQKIGKYRVDFLLPKIKTVVEIDGELYHTKQRTNREAVIQLSLGIEWKILHIPAELIRKDIKKLNTILQHRGKY